MAAERVDRALVARGLCESVEMARALVMAGRVYLGEVKVNKPSEAMKPALPLTVRGDKLPFVSRGGLKLSEALDHFSIDVSDLICVDIGASTGGFTDCLLQAGAKKVYAVDVGYGQLDYRLRSDPRVETMERTNARFVLPEQFDPRPQFGATDVSFISLKAILPAALALLAGEHPRFVALIKPQFEAPAQQAPGGVVRDPQVHREVIRLIASFVCGIGWCARDLWYSPIRGPEGNIEFLLDIAKGGEALGEAAIARVVAHAYDKFVKSR